MVSSNPLRAAVFDIDGTLLRTEHLQWRGWNIALKKYGKHLTKRQNLLYAGQTGKMIEKELIALFHLSARVKPGALSAAKAKFLHAYFSTQPLHWMPGARAALRLCHSHALPIALATSGKRKETLAKLRRLSSLPLFDALVCLDDVKKGKPHPDLYLEACRRLRVRPHEALAFEDTQSGVLSAARAGLRVIAIPTLYSSGQDFSHAWAVCKSFKQAMPKLTSSMRIHRIIQKS